MATQRFAVIGLGQFGQALVVNLTAKGHEVVALDRNANGQIDGIFAFLHAEIFGP